MNTEGESQVTPEDASIGAEASAGSATGGHAGTGIDSGTGGKGAAAGSGGTQPQGGSDGGKAGAGGAAGGGAGTAGEAGADASAGNGGGTAGEAGTVEPDASDGSPDDVQGDVVAEAEGGPTCALSVPNNADCNACMAQNCLSQCIDCATNTECTALVNCVNQCGDDNCKKDCWNNHPDGHNLANALATKGGCLDKSCNPKCPKAPDTSGHGCAMSASAPAGDTSWVYLAWLGLLAAMRRARSRVNW